MEKKPTSIESIKSQITSIKEDVSVLSEAVSLVPDFIEQIVSEEFSKVKEIKGDTGERGVDGIDGLDGKDGIDGKDGLNGSPDTAEEIKSKLESLVGDNRLDAFAIKNLPSFVEKVAKDGYPYGLPQPAGAITYQLNGAQVGRGNILNIIGDNISTSSNGDSVTYDISTSEGLESVAVDNITIIGDGTTANPLQAVTNQTGKGLKQGGAIWSGTGFVFDVSDLYFYIDGTDYVSTATQVTLTASDPTQDRFDIIIVDDTLTVSVITGTPGIPPAQPALAWNQVGVTIVLVSAASTTPTITYDLMYNEDAGAPTEWVAGTYSLSGAVGTINNASTNNPFNGTKCIEATGVNIRRGSLLTRATDVNIQNFSSIQFAFRLDSAITTSQNFNIRFRNSSGTFIGNTVSVFNWGASRTVIGTNQVVVIPITAFGNITNVRSIVGIMAGGTNTPTYNWAWDFIKLADSIPFQSNLGPIYLSPSNTLYSSGAANGATSNSDSIFFGQNSGFQAINANSVIALGKSSGYQASSVDGAVFIGEEAGYQASNSINSVFIGRQAGYGATNTVPSIAIGNASTPLSYENSIVLGFQAVATADNQMTIGSVPIPVNEVIINGNGGIQLPVGTTAERIATQGMIRYNTTTSKFEGYDGSTWVNLN